MTDMHPHLSDTNPPAVMVGGGIGDASGARFEVRTTATTPVVPCVWPGDYGVSEHHGLEAGKFTDDTHLSIALANALMTGGGYRPSFAARSYLRLHLGGIPGLGGTLKRAFENLHKGLPWHQAGIPDSLGNGSAMRASPLGLFYADDPGYAAHIARIDSLITHTHPECVDGAAAVASAVAYLVRDGNKSGLIHDVRAHLTGTQLDVMLAELNVQLAYNRTGEQLRKHFYKTGSNVQETVVWAFACFLATSSFEGAIRMAIEAGGDADTTAAITGALAGGYYGLQGIPLPLREGLDRFEELQGMDEWLFTFGPTKTPAAIATLDAEARGE